MLSDLLADYPSPPPPPPTLARVFHIDFLVGFITAVLEVAGGEEVWSTTCQALPWRPFCVSLIFKQSHEGGVLLTHTGQLGKVSLR